MDSPEKTGLWWLGVELEDKELDVRQWHCKKWNKDVCRERPRIFVASNTTIVGSVRSEAPLPAYYISKRPQDYDWDVVVDVLQIRKLIGGDSEIRFERSMSQDVLKKILLPKELRKLFKTVDPATGVDAFFRLWANPGRSDYVNARSGGLAYPGLKIQILFVLKPQGGYRQSLGVLGGLGGLGTAFDAWVKGLDEYDREGNWLGRFADRSRLLVANRAWEEAFDQTHRTPLSLSKTVLEGRIPLSLSSSKLTRTVLARPPGQD